MGILGIKSLGSAVQYALSGRRNNSAPYWFSDPFSIDAVVGAINGSRVSQTVSRVMVDSGGHASITAGKMVVDGGGGTFGTPYLKYTYLPSSPARARGRAFECEVTPTAYGYAYFGFSRNQSGWIPEHAFYFQNSHAIIIKNGAGSDITPSPGWAYTIGHSYRLRIVLCATGAEYWISVDSGQWTLVYADPTGVNTYLSTGFSNYSMAFTCDYIDDRKYTNIDFYDAFQRSDGYLAAASPGYGISDSGYQWYATGSLRPSVTSNRVVIDDAANGAAYLYQQFPAVPNMLAVDFLYYGDGTSPGGSFTLAFSDVLGSVANLLHLNMNDTAWGLTTRTDSGAFPILISGSFATPLTVSIVHHAEMHVAGSTATLLLPDGSIHSVTDDLVASHSYRFAFWELSRNADARLRPALVRAAATF